MNQSDIIKKKLIEEFEKKSSPTPYEIFRKKIIRLLRCICICLRYPLIYIQEFLINLETKINKML